ncbi:MAG TPA: universal stress protein [Acidobacteriaceae bacterium]|nr:universal stress protein [Acidobacteriaceae bacterium]
MTSNILRFRTIVVATDLGDPGSAALRYAQAMARMYKAILVVVHVIDPLAYAFPEGAPAYMAANQAALSELKKIEEEAQALGIPVHSVVESGMICDRILQALTDYKADLLVLGTRARSEAGRAALGTVARQLLARSHCPILAVSPDAAKSLPWAGCWLRVLAATDFSPASIRALRCAHQVALRQLVLLHVSEDAKEAGCQERLRFLAPFNESHTVPVEHLVAEGDVSQRIVESARKFGADLVVLGSPESELTADDLQTSTVLQVISKVECPVLCLPAIPVPVKEQKREVALTSGFSL